MDHEEKNINHVESSITLYNDNLEHPMDPQLSLFSKCFFPIMNHIIEKKLANRQSQVTK